MQIANPRRTVLVVEDDPAVRRLVTTYLERMGLSVIEAGDGRTALRKLTETVPDLVCLDLMLPELSGYEVCEFIRQSPPLRDVPVMVMSGRALPNDRALAAEVGVSGYLIKPFSHGEFCNQVSALLGTFAAAKGNGSGLYADSQWGWQRAEGNELFDRQLAKEYLAYGLGAISRRKLLAAAVFLVALGSTIASLFVLPKTYFAETRILVQSSQMKPGNWGHPIPGDPEVATRAASETILRRDSLVVLIKQTDLIDSWRLSRAPLMQLKDDLFAQIFGPLTGEDKLNALVGTLEKKLRVITLDGTVTIWISWPDAQMAYRLVEAAEQNFLETRHVAEVSNIVEAIAILEGHANNVRDSMLEEIDRRGETTSVKADGSLLARLAWREAQDPELIELKVMLQAKRRLIQDLEDFRHRRLAELTAELERQQSVHAPSHPAIVNLEQTIFALSRESPKLVELHKEEQELLADYGKRGGSTEDTVGRGTLKPRLSLPEAAKPAMPQTVAIKRERPAPNDDLSIEYAKTRLSTALSKYDGLLERIDAARIELDTARAAFKHRYSVITPPQVPYRAAKPSVKMVIAGGFIAALALAIFAAIAADLRAGRIYARWQIERLLNLPIVAEVQKP